MKKVVLLAPYFLPRRRVGSWRPFKFAIHLKEFGWEPYVITIQDSGGELTEKENRLLEDVQIYKIAPPFDRTQRSGSSIKTEKSGSSRNIFEPVLDWIDKNFPIDTWLPLFWLRKRQILNVIEEISPDVLWSTGDPWSGHWLANEIRREKKIPWVADFRDPWTLGNVNLKERTAFSEAIDRKAERSVLKNAAAVTFTSKATETLYQNHYPELDNKTATLYNCFDRALYDEITATVEPLFDTNKLNLLFFGKFRRLSPARPLADILAKLENRYSGKELPVEVHSFGSLSDEDEAYARHRGVLSYFTGQTPVPGEKTVQVLSQADLLWLSTNPERNNIIPAKLWDYLAARRPIVSIAPNPEIGTIIEQTGTGVQMAPHDREEAAELLHQCVLAKQEGKPLPVPTAFNNEMIKKYEAKHVTKQLASIFDQLA